MPTENASPIDDAASEERTAPGLSFTAAVLLRGEALEAARASYPSELGGLEGLARALAVSPIWGDRSQAVLVFRTAPDPFMAVVGHVDAASRTRLDALRSHLPLALRTLRYVEYEQAERDSARLAEQLEQRLGRAYLERCHFTALPRGGFIVLGMLSYTLGLTSAQLQPAPPDAPLVLVDNCALTGSHVRAVLQKLPQTEVTFATLYAHPDLRAALEARHERVHACVSAHDLQDHAPRHLGADYAAWRGHAGFPQMRMRPEQADRFVGGHEDLARVLPWVDKRRVPIGSGGFGAFRSQPAPLAAPSRVEEAEHDIVIEPVPSVEALATLFGQSFVAPLANAAVSQAERLEQLGHLVSNIPVRRITYRSGYDRLPAVRAALLDDVRAL